MMSPTRCTLVVIALLALCGAWFAVHPNSPPLSAAQAVKPQEKKAEKEAPLLDHPFAIAEMLETTIDYSGIDAKETKLGEELDRITKNHRVQFRANEQAFRDKKCEHVLDTKIAESEPIPPLRSSLDHALRMILSHVVVKSGATYLIRKDHVEITTEAAVRLEFGMAPAKGNERLPAMVTAQFAKKSLKDTLERIASLTGSTVVLDPRVGNKGETAITARLLNVPIQTSVCLVADLAGLEVVRMENVFYVTSAENAAKLRKARERDSTPVAKAASRRAARP